MSPPGPETLPIDHNHSGKRKQLSEGMAHLQNFVTVPAKPPAAEDPSTYGVPAGIQPLRKPRTEASNANPDKRTDPFQFGSRYLEDGDDIFSFNAWDHVETDDAYKEFADGQFEMQKASPVSDFDKKRFNENPEKWWNKFYANNTSNFFKNRKWLHQEFPILTALTQTDSPPTLLLETGAGAGNTAFPILSLNKNPRLRIHACDFSKKAVEVIKANEAYTHPEDNTGVIEASVWDVVASPDPETNELKLPEGIAPGSVDVVLMIFIFSALAPGQWEQAVRNTWHLLKPGGVVLFRDYGRGDLAQVRFKKGRWMEENFYVRGDGTRVYFFEEEELRRIWGGQIMTRSLSKRKSNEQSKPSDAELAENGVASLSIIDESTTSSILQTKPNFEVIKFGVDRRMLVNRQRRLKMYRCWMQAEFRKTAEIKDLNSSSQPTNGIKSPSAVDIMATEVAAEQPAKHRNG